MKVSKKIVGISLASALALSATASFAAMPVKTVIVNNKAYSFDYLNNNLAPKLDVAAAIGAQDPIYVKIGTLENPTYYNVITKSFADAQDLPAVTYYDDDGLTTPYEAGDTDADSDNDAAIAAALDAIDNAISSSELLAALQNEKLDLVAVNATDADYEAAYLEAISDFKFAANSQAETISDSVAAVQAVVNAVNARMDINAASNEDAMKAAVTAFIEAKLAIGNLDTKYIPLFDQYLGVALPDEAYPDDQYRLGYDDEERIAIAKIVLSVRNEVSGYGGLADVVYHAHGNGIASVLEERHEWIDGINDALDTVDNPATADEDERANAVEAKLNNIPASLAIDPDNTDFHYDKFYDLDGSPENDQVSAAVAEFIKTADIEAPAPERFANLAGILSALDAAVETVTATE